MAPLLNIAIVLTVALGVGVFAVVMARGWMRRAGDDHGDWEKTLVDWRNLRDQGVLSEEEFRKLRTLVEPRTRLGTPDPAARTRSVAGHPGPDFERT